MALRCPSCGFDNLDDALSCDLCQNMLRRAPKKAEPALPGSIPGTADDHNLKATFLLGQNAVAEALIELREFELASACYERVVELDPDRPEAHFALGKSLQRRKLWDQAVPRLEKALALAPDHALADEAHLLCGAHYASSGALDPQDTDAAQLLQDIKQAAG